MQKPLVPKGSEQGQEQAAKALRAQLQPPVTACCQEAINLIV